MYRLLYLSAATDLFSKDQLVELLKKSRRNNHEIGVTGILLYKDGDFLQLLEGEKSAVETLFKKINRDPRHTGVCTLLAEECKERLFADWSMAFRDLADPALLREPGYSDFLNKPLGHQAFKDHPDEAMKLVGVFATPLRR